MAIGLRMKLDEGTQAIEGGWGVIDFWESRHHFDRFSESRLGPAIASVGDEGPGGPPDMKEFPVHKIINP